MKKGQKLVRPHYKTMWQKAEQVAHETDVLRDQAEIDRDNWKSAWEASGKAVLDARDSDARHMKWMLRFGILDVALAAAMLYLLATR